MTCCTSDFSLTRLSSRRKRKRDYVRFEGIGSYEAWFSFSFYLLLCCRMQKCWQGHGSKASPWPCSERLTPCLPFSLYQSFPFMVYYLPLQSPSYSFTFFPPSTFALSAFTSIKGGYDCIVSILSHWSGFKALMSPDGLFRRKSTVLGTKMDSHVITDSVKVAFHR